MKYINCFTALALFLPFFASAKPCTESLLPNSVTEPVGLYRSNYLGGSDTPGPTAYMYKVRLWRSGNCFFGYFFATESREGGAPRGLIDDFVYNPKTGVASFRSKLTEAYVHQGMGAPPIPGKSLFEFSGTFDKRKFSGRIKRSDFTDETEPDYSSQVTVLTRRKDRMHEIDFGDDQTYGAWLEDAKEMLKVSVHGPEW